MTDELTFPRICGCELSCYCEIIKDAQDHCELCDINNTVPFNVENVKEAFRYYEELLESYPKKP